MNHDSDKTMILSQQTRRPGAPGDDLQPMHVLPKGTRLGEFEVVDLIGEGGFGAVYLVYDHSLDRHVALKEYMPTGLATRTQNFCVTVRSQANAATFNAGLKSFINEAKMLAQFDSASLVKVHRFWEANGTAYMVMPYYEGSTLKQALRERRIKPDEPWLRLLLADLFDAIETIHRAKCYHRDIAPDNILLLKDGRPLLLDFGAARRVIGDLTQCLTVILKPGFAPIEQYADIAGLRQGPWTDIYALAAVVYFLVSGAAPPPAVARIVHDDMVPARVAGRGKYSDGFLAVIDKGLSVKPEHRYQSIGELRAALDALPQPTVTRMRTERPRREPFLREEEPTLKVPATGPVSAGHGHTRPAAAAPASRTWKAPPAHAAAERRSKTRLALAGAMLAAGIGSGLAVGNYLAQSMRGEQAEATAPALVPERAAELAAPAAPPAPAPVLPPVAKLERQPEPPAPTPAPRAAGELKPAPPPVSETPRSLEREAPPAPAPAPIVQGPPALPTTPAPASAPAPAEPAAAAPVTAAPPVANKRISEPERARRAPETAGPQREARSAASQPKPPATRPASAQSPEESLWDVAVALNAAPAFESYLEQYPRGRFAALARDRLAGLRPRLAESSGSSGPAEPVPAPAAADPPARAAPQAPPPPPPPASERQAAVKMETPPVVTAPPTLAAQPEPAAPQGDKKRLELADQTMIGDFTLHPATGIVSGSGRIVWKNGNRFEGTLVNGIKQGKGSFTWRNGQRYVGDWERDTPNGRGTITYPNGNRYQGEVRDGFPHGSGTISYAGGDTYKGDWVRGKSHGQGRYTWRNGSYWEGEFRDDQRTENGKLVFSEEALKAAQAKR